MNGVLSSMIDLNQISIADICDVMMVQESELFVKLVKAGKLSVDSVRLMCETIKTSLDTVSNDNADIDVRIEKAESVESLVAIVKDLLKEIKHSDYSVSAEESNEVEITRVVVGG